VTSETGDDPVEIRRVGVMGAGGVKMASGRGFTRQLLGTFSIPASGLYTVRATPELPDAVEPQIIVGE
jgi:hypothetical protein